MGATICYRKTRRDKAQPTLPVNAPSSFLDALSRALSCDRGGVFRLTESDIPLIRGLAAGVPHEAETFDIIIEALEENDLEIWPEY